MYYLLSPFFMLFFLLCKIMFFLTFFVFLYIIIYILNISSAIKKMSVNKLRDFIFENYYKRIWICKEKSYYSMKHLKKKEIYCCLQTN